MDADEAKKRMREIQRIMETATLYTLLPGAAAIIGGALVFAGCGVSMWMLQSGDFSKIVELSAHQRVAHPRSGTSESRRECSGHASLRGQGVPRRRVPIPESPRCTAGLV